MSVTPDYVDTFSDDLMTVTLTVDYGTLNVSLPAVTTVMVNGNNTGSVILVGTLSDLNALIDTPTSPSGVFPLMRVCLQPIVLA